MLLLAITYLLASVQAIFLENAFKHEHVSHFLDSVYSVHPVSAHEAIGLGNGQLMSITTQKNPIVQWAVDLRDSVFDRISLANKRSHVFAYSQDSNVLHMYSTTTGTLIEDYKFPENVLQVDNFMNKGALVLTSKALYVVSDAIHKITDVSSERIHVSSVNGSVYVFANKLIQIDPTSLEFSTNKIGFSVAQVKDDVVKSTTNELYRITNTVEMVKLDTKDFQIVNSDYILGSDLQFYKGGVKSHKVNGDDNFLISSALSEYLVVKKGKHHVVYDLTDFLELDDPSSIKEIRVPRLLNQTFIEDNLLISHNGAGECVKYDLTDGSLLDSYSIRAPPMSKHILVDKTVPSPFEAMGKDREGFFNLWFIVKRALRHMSEFGRYVTGMGTKSAPIDHGFGKYVVGYQDSQIVATDSETGQISWTLETEGPVLGLVHNNGTLVALSETALYAVSPSGELLGRDHLQKKYSEIIAHNGQLVLGGPGVLDLYVGPLIDTPKTVYLHRVEGNTVSGYKVSPEGSIKTWTFKDDIRSVHTKPDGSSSRSIAISLANKDILYKYLYKDTIVVVTGDKLFLLDTFTGRTLHVQKLPVYEEGSLNVVMDDNWIVYSYVSDKQYINVIDLMDTAKAVDYLDSPLRSVFGYNNTIDGVSEKSFVLFEKVVALGSTQSRLGITSKSILALTEYGKLLEIPKVVLNSRRIDNRPLTQADLHEFRMSPYNPEIITDHTMVVNHKHKLFVDNETEILVSPTHFESSIVVAVLNRYNMYVGVVQPSLSFDLLGQSFAYVKLLVTIGVLVVGWGVSKWRLDSKRLREVWIDRE